MTDKELVTLWQKGNMEAFDVLYEKYKDEAYRTACLITGNRADGEDLAQEAFVICAQSIHALKDGEKFRAWLLRGLTRNAWKFCKKKRRENPVSEFFETGETESALDEVLQNETHRELYQAMQTLAEKQRSVVVLYYFDNLTTKEIANVMGLMEGTVKSRLFSARRILRRVLTEKGTFGEELQVHG